MTTYPTEEEHDEVGDKEDSVIYKENIIKDDDLPTEEEHDEVGDKEGAPARLVDIVGEPPDVTQTHSIPEQHDNREEQHENIGEQHYAQQENID